MVSHKRRCGLWRRGAVYQYRVRVPADLKSLVGATHINRSLRTTSFTVASRLVRTMAYEIEKSFEALKGGGPIAVGPPSFARTGGPIAGFSKGLLLPIANGAPSLSQVAERYLNDPSSQRTSKSLMIYRTTFEAVCSIVGPDTPIDIISRETCRDVLSVLQCLPSNARKRFPGMTPREAAANAQANGITAMSAANVNEYLNKLSTLLNWAVREEMIARNPARGLRIADTVAARDKRRPFTPLQLQRIFDAPLYRGCRNDENGYATQGDQKPKRARYWIPLIALFSGMRQNEICQLHTADAREVEGVLCFVVCADSGDDKHLKTVASQRLVPVHPILIRMGIIGYISDRRRAGDVRLFPELRPDFYGLFSGKFSTWFRRCGSACKKDPLSGVIGVQQGPLISMV